MWLDEKSQCFINFAAFPVRLQGNKIKISRSCFDRSQLIIIVTLRGNMGTLLARLEKETDRIEASLFFFPSPSVLTCAYFRNFDENVFMFFLLFSFL